jgi:ParB/RepB/Spo0J family partition protein
MVPLSLIDVDGLNPREKGERLEEAIKEKMESMRQHGQLHPIRLYRKPDGRFLVGFGHLRREAAMRLAWEDIRAEIFPMPDNMAEVYDARDRENLDQRTLNPLEEMLLVAQALKRNRNSIPATAAQLGRSDSWVRARSYVAKLDHVVCEMLSRRQIEPGHARELAKLADMEGQRIIARAGARTEEGGGRSIDWFKGQVEKRRRSLRVIPWKLDATFAGKRACVGCPANTATDAMLFEIADGAGYCMNPACFAEKQIAASEAAAKTVRKVQERAEGTGGQATPQMYREAAPAHVKPESVVDAATGTELSDREKELRARIRKAAPELFTACKWMLAKLKGCQGPEFAAAQAVIAEIERES